MGMMEVGATAIALLLLLYVFGGATPQYSGHEAAATFGPWIIRFIRLDSIAFFTVILPLVF